MLDKTGSNDSVEIWRYTGDYTTGSIVKSRDSEAFTAISNASFDCPRGYFHGSEFTTLENAHHWLEHLDVKEGLSVS